MSMKTTKYKLSDMAKDLKVTNNDLIECLGKLGGEPKKTQSVLNPEEISYVLEYYTQNNQVDSFDAFYANNVKPAKEEKKADKKPVKAEKKEKKAEKKPEPKPAPKAEAKPEPKPAPKVEAKPEPKAEPKVEKKPEVKAETKQPAPEQKKKQPALQKPAKKKEHGVRQQLGGFSDKKEASGGYTISEDNDSFGTQRTIDTRGSYIELDKYNEKYDNLANSKQNKSKDNFTKKQKLTQKSQQRKKQQFSHKKETESEKLRRLELERARKQQLKVMIPDEIVVSELASRLKVTATEVIKKLMGLGVMASINEVVDFDTAALVAEELGAKVEKEVHVTIEERLIETDEDPEESLQERCPVVVVMGHVDHGKTSILDRIRNAHVTDTEAGGITQHIGAYQVEYEGKKITFLDTPGHEAFTAMRARGANVTDIAILVVAADDGIMPQTIESINHAKAAGVSIIVAINKMDKEGADPDRVKQQLTEQSLVVEEWGGDVIAVPVSAKTGMGIDELLENILLVAEVKELKANPDRLARGTVVEARLDKGKGPVATLLVQNGTLKSGDVIIAGTSVGRIRTMTNDKGRSIKEAGPSTPVEITGLGEVPSAGDVFNAVADEKLARELVEQRKHEAKEEQFQQHQKVTLDNLFSQIAEGEMKELPIIVKADVQGSVEAVKQSLEKLSNDEVRVKVIHGGVGAVSESDVMLANASNAIIVGFNVRPDPVAKQNAEQSGVDIRLYRIIYDAIEEITDAMKGMLAPKYREVETARIEVRQVYKISNVGTVAGSYVLDGKVGRNNEIRVVRDGIVIAEDKMSSLKRFKDDAKEVAAGFECGITLEKFTDIKEGDIFEAFYMEEYRD
ncbi:translation initiation factor IF-2 [Ruminococcus bicirculans (ex Wegman et al. 2014)]|uniref:Translation initiation factor IF-2 n=1 Tax=Ruminococcus bicirculans (ex Wegman et al. 2014) TaxID=1160721 RepID=A0AAW5KKB0_9FIRM|nr:translation initiation factor IF-2 [Ruminococcus bicirculans (ex Wegman et al. 2014)]MCQ5152373.1 translation initiation factor IF-2 [Ruminococcus bicirculans (ex Wegman et al. 2014)]